jgi:CHASE2 domain-containing sensor protein
VIRRLPYRVDRLLGFSILAAAEAPGVEVGRSRPAGTSAWIDYRGPPGSFDTRSYLGVLRGDVDPAAFKSKVVVVGPTAPSLGDIHTASTGSGMAGPEMQANAIWTAMHRFPLRSSSTPLAVSLIVLLGLLPGLSRLWLGRGWAVTAGLAAGLAYAICAQLLFNRGIVLPVVYPLLALLLGLSAALVSSRPYPEAAPTSHSLAT